MFDKNCVQNKYGESKKTIAYQQESKLQEQNLAAFTCRAAYCYMAVEHRYCRNKTKGEIRSNGNADLETNITH